MPIISTRSSCLVMTANAARIPPNAREPQSPMKILAGCALNTKKPVKPPINAAPKIAASTFLLKIAKTTNGVNAMIIRPVASPSNPSVKFTAFDSAVNMK